MSVSSSSCLIGFGGDGRAVGVEDPEERLNIAKVCKIDIGMHRKDLELL